MRKYTQKVDAIQFTGTFESLKKIVKEFDVKDRIMIYISDTALEITRMVIDYYEDEDYSGGTNVYKDDYLVKDAKGSLKRFRKEDFETLFK